MSLADVFLFAARALSGHRLRTGLSLLGMAIGVAAVIVLTALGEGARRYVIDQFASIGTNFLAVVPGHTETTGLVPGSAGVPHDLTLDDALAIARGVREVAAIAPMSMGTESVAHGDRRRQVAVVGTTHEYVEIRKLRMAQGLFLPPGELSRGASVAVLGWKLAQEIFPGESPLGKLVRIGDWRMRVIGVLEEKGVQLGFNLDEIVLVPVATGMKMFDRTGLFRVIVEVRANADLPAARNKVAALMKERHREEDVTVLTEDALVSTFSSILTALTLALGAIAAVSLTVAGIGIMNVMLVSVSERTREVGLLRALGTGRRQVLAVFLAEAILLSSLGGVAGLLLGWGAVRILVGVFPALPAAPPTWAVASAIALAIGAGAGFGYLPARRATRLDPVVALARR